MKNIVLAAGYATRMYPLTENFPKPLLPVGSSTILDKMLEDVDALDEIDEHIIVTNHRFIGIFEEWSKEASKRYSKPIRLLDDGSTSNDNRIGAVGDLIAAIRKFDIKDDILVAAADNLLDFSLSSLVSFFKEKGTAVIFYYDEMDEARLHRCGVICMDEDGRVTDMEEKPAEPKSHHVTPPFYIYGAKDIPVILDAIANGCQWDAPGNLAGHISRVSELHAMKMPGKRLDIGSLEGYRAISGQN
ncbi:MAG: NTP transferase domain-containing protein [Bacteroidales bacterium]|nr:NTP transferase domain-containing protein [Bacteroidales bacterium]